MADMTLEEALFVADEQMPLRVPIYAALLVLAAEVRKRQWVPVTERLPDDGVPVIVNGGVAILRGDEWRTLTGYGWPGTPIQWKVTHWMPLPAPPGGEP